MNLSVDLRVGKTVWGFFLLLWMKYVYVSGKRRRAGADTVAVAGTTPCLSVTLKVLYITHMSSAQVLTAFPYPERDAFRQKCEELPGL